MKRLLPAIISIVLALSFIVAVSTVAYADDSTEVTGTFTVQGKTFGSEKEAVVARTLDGSDPYFSYRWLTTYSNTAYNKNLATIAALMVTEAYNDCYVSMHGEGGDVKQETILITDLGFDDIKLVKLNRKNFAVDKNDLTEVSLGHRILTVNGKKYNAFVAVIGGTRGTEADWLSNYDVGCDSDAYYEIPSVGSSHPDWVNKARHKGFDVSATRIKKEIDRYISEYSVDGAENTLLITGHSRGASIANILGTYYEDSPAIKSYTYAFACPPTTTEGDALTGSYRTIFNLINSDDFTSIMPLPEWGFKRYGTDITMNVSENAALVKTINSYRTDGDYKKPNLAVLKKKFLEMVPTRESLYKTVVYETVYGLDDLVKPGKGLNEDNHLFYIVKQLLEGGNEILGDSDMLSFEISENGIDKARAEGCPVGTTKISYKPVFMSDGLARLMGNRKDINKILVMFIGYWKYAYITSGPEGLMDNIQNGASITALDVLANVALNSTKLAAPHNCSTFYSMTLYTVDKAVDEAGDDDGICSNLQKNLKALLERLDYRLQRVVAFIKVLFPGAGQFINRIVPFIA